MPVSQDNLMLQEAIVHFVARRGALLAQRSEMQSQRRGFISPGSNIYPSYAALLNITVWNE